VRPDPERGGDAGEDVHSAARSFIAARSSALKPSDSVWELFAGILTLPFDA